MGFGGGFKGGAGDLGSDLKINDGTIKIKEQANAETDTTAYGQIWVKSNAPCDLYFTDDTGQDIRITNDGSLAAAGSAASVKADDIEAGDAAVTISTTTGNVTIDSNAGTAKLDGHTGVNIVSSNSGEVDITSAAAIDINATTGITADGTTVSIDGTDDSNFTVTGSGKDLDLAVAGGGTQELRLASAGTGASAMHLNASAGGIDIDSADMIDIDAADEITIDTTSTDGHIAITSAHTAGQSILISANADAGAILDIDAGIIDIDVQDTINIDAADEIEIATTSADGHITLTSAHTSGLAFHIDANADAASEVQIDAGVLDIDVTGDASLDSSAGSITIGAALADGQTLKLGKNGAVETIIAPHGTAGSEAYSVTNTAGTTDGAYGQGAMLFEATAGGMGLKWADDKDLWAEGGQAVITANHNTSEAIKLHADAGASQTIQIINDEGTTDGSYGAGAVDIEATAGGISLLWADGKDLWAEGGRTVITANEDAAECIKLHADAGTSQTIKIVNDEGTETGAEAEGAILIEAAAGGIGLHGADDKKIWAEAGQVIVTANENAADAIKLHADAGANQTITLLNDAGTGASAVGITSTAGGVTISGDTDHGVIVGNVSGGPVTIGHATSETTVSDNLTVTGNGTFNGAVTLGNAAEDVVTVTGQMTASAGVLLTGPDINFGNAAADVITVTGQMTASAGVLFTGPDINFGNAAADVITCVGQVTASAPVLLSGEEIQLGNAAADVVKLIGQMTASNGVLFNGHEATFGVDATGMDVRMYSNTTNEGVFYDASQDELALLLTTKLKFHDVGGGEEIYANGDGNLVINAGADLSVTAPTIDFDSNTQVTIDCSNTSNGISIGTATSGVPITIGHATSETTIADNLTITGELDITGGEITLGTGDHGEIEVDTSAHGADGKNLTISAGNVTAGTTNDKVGGSLILSTGNSKGDITAPVISLKASPDKGSAASTLNTVEGSGNFGQVDFSCVGTGDSGIRSGDVQFAQKVDKSDMIFASVSGECARVHDGHPGDGNSPITNVTGMGYGLGYKAPLGSIANSGGVTAVTLTAKESGYTFMIDASTDNSGITITLPQISGNQLTGLKYTFLLSADIHANADIVIRTAGAAGDDADDFYAWNIVNSDTAADIVSFASDGDKITLDGGNSVAKGSMVEIMSIFGSGGAEAWFAKAYTTGGAATVGN